MPRRYFTCPIKALYMVKEFGVELKFKKPVENRTGERFLDMGDLWISDVDVTNHGDLRILSLISCRDIPKLYVCKHSESIFEPQKGDEGRWSRAQGAHYANFNGFHWVSAGIEEIEPKIIMRDNKHFFAGELEND